MYIARKIAYNILASATGKIVSTIIALVNIGLITRYLGKAGFGEYAIVLAFFSFFGAVADLGFYAISTREISRKGADSEKIVGNVFTLRLFTSLLTFLISPLLVIFFPYDFSVKVGIVIIAGAFIFSSSYQVLIGVFQKHLAMGRVALSELIGRIVQFAIIFWAVKYDAGFFWIVGALVGQMLITSIVIFILAQKLVPFKLRINFDYWKSFLRQALPLGISVFITFLYFKADTILLSILKGSEEVGIYNAAYKIIENLTFFPAMVAGLVLPIISENIFSDRKRFEEISEKTIKFFLVVVLPLIVGALFLADQLIFLIGGEAFGESAQVLRVLIFALGFIFFGNIFNNILIAGNLQKKLMLALGVCAVFNITLNFFLIPRYSYLGASLTSVATEFLVILLTGYLIVTQIKYVPKFKGVGRIASAALMMGVVLFFIRDFNFFIQVFLAGGIYLLFLVIFKAIQKEEILSIVSKGVSR